MNLDELRRLAEAATHIAGDDCYAYIRVNAAVILALLDCVAAGDAMADSYCTGRSTEFYDAIRARLDQEVTK